jgi:hypothetical protein
MNGAPGDRIWHGRGLRQSDSLSPMLFILVMDVLDAIIRKADALSVLRSLGLLAILFWTTLYVDDLMLFVYLEAPDLQSVWPVFRSRGNLVSLFFL